MIKGSRIPKRKTLSAKQIEVFSTDAYWRTVNVTMPALSVIVRIATAACATEAATERTFSSEAIIHSKLRNRLATEKVNNRGKIRWNFEKIGALAVAADELDADLKEIRALYRHLDGRVHDEHDVEEVEGDDE